MTERIKGLKFSDKFNIKKMFQDFSEENIQYIFDNYDVQTILELSNYLLKSKKAQDPEVESHLLGFESYSDRQRQIKEFDELKKGM